jgi:recombination protein RecT
MGTNLTERVATQTGNGDAGTAVARKAGPNLASQIQKMQKQFQNAMPKGMEATQLIRDALTALRTQKNLANCDELSVLGGLMTFAQLGLRPHVPSLGHGWLIPFRDKNTRTYKAQIVIGYKGYVDLAHRSGRIASLVGHTVYTNDHFKVAYGLDEKLVHEPARPGPRGDATDYYTIVRYNDGGRNFWHMSKVECEEHRDRFAMAKDRKGNVVGPWHDHFDSMATKTTFLQLSRWMPKSTELAAAIAADETVRMDLSADNFDALFHTERPDIVEGEIVDDTEQATEGPA